AVFEGGPGTIRATFCDAPEPPRTSHGRHCAGRKPPWVESDASCAGTKPLVAEVVEGISSAKLCVWDGRGRVDAYAGKPLALARDQTATVRTSSVSICSSHGRRARTKLTRTTFNAADPQRTALSRSRKTARRPTSFRAFVCVTVANGGADEKQ